MLIETLFAQARCLQNLMVVGDLTLNLQFPSCLVLHTITETEGIVSFAEANEIIIGPKAVRTHWPVLPDCQRSVELVEIPIGICSVGALAALPDHLPIVLAFSVSQQV